MGDKTMAEECELNCNYWEKVVGPWILDDDGNKTVRDGSLGYVNDLLDIAVERLTKAKGLGQLTNNEMGLAYAAIIPAAFKDAIMFTFSEQKTDAEVGETKAKTSAMLAETVARLVKEWGYGEAKIANGVDDTYTLNDGTVVVYNEETIVLGDPDEDGRIDKQVDEIEAGTTRNNMLAGLDGNIKTQQELAEKIKNGEVLATHTYSYVDANGTTQSATTTDLQDVVNSNGWITDTVYTDATGTSIYELQKLEVTAKTSVLSQENRMLANKSS